MKKATRVLKEDENAQKLDTPENPVSLNTSSPKSRPARDSVDDQIDALLLRYENSSIKPDDEKASLDESLGSLNLKFLIEQEDDEEEATEPEPDAAEAPEEDEDIADPAGSEDMTVSEPEVDVKVPNLDIDTFTNRVVRLASNYENLLRVEEAVVNRAKNFLDENYGDVFVNAFLINLREKYGLDTDEFRNKETVVPDEEYAVGAYAGGTGSSTGG